MQIIKSGEFFHEILPQGALSEALAVIGEVISQPDSEDARERALLQFLRYIKTRTGFDGPEMAAILRDISGNPTQAVKRALNQWDKAQAAINRLVALQGDDPWLFNADGQGGIRLLTLADINGKTPVDLDITLGRKAEPETGEFLFTFAGDAKAAITLEVADAKELQKDFGISGVSPATDLFTVFSVLGELGVQGTGERGGSAGEIGVSAGLQGSASAHLLFQHAPAKTTVTALADSVADLVDPFDLDSIARRLKPRGAQGLQHIRFHGASSGWIDLDLNLARAVSTPTLVKTPEGATNLPLNQWLNAKVKASYRAEATRELSVTREPGGIILTTVQRSMQRRSLGVTVGAGIELVGLGEVAGQWAAHLLPDLGELKATLEEFAKPGDMLVERIDAILDEHDPWVQSLGNLLLGQSDAQSAASELTDHLMRRVTDAVDTAVDVFDVDPGKPEELAARITSHMTKDNELLKVYGVQIQQWLTEALGNALTSVWSSLENEVEKHRNALLEKIDAGASDAVTGVLRPLEEYGKSARELVKDLNQHATELLSPVIKLLQRYGEQRQKLIAAVEKSAKAKLALSLAITRSREQRSGATARYRLELPSEGQDYPARTVSDYRRWLIGRLPLDADFGGMATLEDGSVQSGISGSYTTNVTLDLGALSFGYRELVEAKADFNVALDGTILVGTAGFKGRKSTSQVLGSATAEARFSGLIPVIGADGAVSGDPFSIGYTYSNDDCEAGDLEALFATVRRFRSSGVFGILPVGRDRLLIDAWENRLDPRARVDVTGVIPADALQRLVDRKFNSTSMAELLWLAYEARNPEAIRLAYHVMKQEDESPADMILRLAEQNTANLERTFSRRLKKSSGLGSASVRSAPTELVKLVSAYAGVERFFVAVQAYQAWRKTLAAPVGATLEALQAWTERVTAEAFDRALDAARGLSAAVDAAGQAVATHEVPPDLLALLTYLDERLEEDEVVSALNLETAPKGSNNKWQLVPV